MGAGADLPTGAMSVPDLQLSLGNGSSTSPCSDGGGSVLLQQVQTNFSSSAKNGLVKLSILFANPIMQQCVKDLDRVTTVSFQLNPDLPRDAGPVSFCLAHMQLLPAGQIPAGNVPKVGQL